MTRWQNSYKLNIYRSKLSKDCNLKSRTIINWFITVQYREPFSNPLIYGYNAYEYTNGLV